MTSRCASDVRRRAQPALGTLIDIRVRDAGDCADVDAAIDAAFAAVRRVHALMSFHDPASELGRLNRWAARKAVAVSRWTFEVLMLAAALGRASDGAFDCAVAPVLVRLGLLPAPDRSVPARRGHFHERLELLPGRRVRFRAPMWVDLGGIAKGFAVDRAVEALRERGVVAASVNAGGDLRVFGDVTEPILVRVPDDPSRVVALAQLRDAALATSADYGADANQPTPFIDAHTLECCGRKVSVSVAAPDCATADALTKVVIASGDPDHPLLARLGASARVVSGVSR